MFAAALTAQTKAPAKRAPVGPEAVIWRLDSVNVEGNRLYPKEKILLVAGLKLGQMAGKTEFEAARDRLLNTGYFESVAYRFDPVDGQPAIRGTFQVTEIAQVYAWRLDDLPVTREEFRKAVTNEPLLGDKIPASDALTKRIAALIQQTLAARNVTETVQARLMPEAGLEMVVVFRPKAAPPSIAELAFSGSKVWSDAELRKRIASIAIGTVFTESTFRELLNANVRPMFEAKGYMRTQFTLITARPVPDVKGVVVEVEVKDGETFKLASIVVNGAPISNEEALRIGEFKLGDTINFSDIGVGLRKITDSLKEMGYLKADSRVTRRINDEARTVDVTVDFTAGIQYRFRTLELKGLDLITEPVIRKLWALKEGEPFKESYPKYFLDRVRGDGIFDDLGETKFERKVDDKAGLVDVTLIFEPMKRPEGEARPRRRR